jgi:hypothetical protein
MQKRRTLRADVDLLDIDDWNRLFVVSLRPTAICTRER